MNSFMKIIDLTGQKFGRLVVLKENGRSNKGEKVYECKCDCGNVVNVPSSYLRSKWTQSCGCLQRDRAKEASTIHGDTYSSLYSRYKHILWRCNNPKSKDYQNYGGRGITVCKEWENDYQSFKKWSLENGYEEHLTIDRIDVNGNYEPNNCRWVSLLEQENNRRDSVYLSFNGLTKTASQWARILEIKPSRLYYMKRKGKSDDEIFSYFPEIAEVLKKMKEGE